MQLLKVGFFFLTYNNTLDIHLSLYQVLGSKDLALLCLLRNMTEYENKLSAQAPSPPGNPSQCSIDSLSKEAGFCPHCSLAEPHYSSQSFHHHFPPKGLS